MKQILVIALLLLTQFSIGQDFSIVKEQILEENITEAKKALLKMIKEDPLNAEAHYWLGATMHRAYCSSELNPEKDEKLIVDAGISFEKAKFLNEDCMFKADNGKQLKSYSGKVYNLGVMFYQKGNVEMAFTFFKMSVTATEWLGETDLESMYYTGHCANKLDDPLTAKGYLEQVLNQQPENVKAVKELLKAEVALGEYDEAKMLLKAALVYHPEDEYLWKELVFLGVKMDDNEEALAAAQTLSHLDSGNPKNLAFLASLYDQTGNTEKAISSYTSCLALDPSHPKVSYNVGVLLYNEAIMVLNLSPSDELKTKAVEKLIDAKIHLENAQELDPLNEDIASILKNIQNIN